MCTQFPGCVFFHTDEHFCTLFSANVAECDSVSGPPVPEQASCNEITTTPTTTQTTTQTTTPTTTPITTPITTTNYPFDCEYDGQTHPYPGDCHKYYVCYDPPGDDIDEYTVLVFDCGEWVFDPNQGSCIWPEVSNDLCPPKFWRIRNKTFL